MTTPLLQYVARFDGGGDIFGFGGGGYKESWSWCSLFVELPSLFVATSGEDCAVMCNLINIHTYIHTYPLEGSMRVA